MDSHNITVIIQADGSAAGHCGACQVSITILESVLRGSPLSLAPEHPLTLPCPGPARGTGQTDPNMTITNSSAGDTGAA